MTNLDLVQNAKVHSLYCKCVLLQGVQQQLLLLMSSEQIIYQAKANGAYAAQHVFKFCLT